MNAIHLTLTQKKNLIDADNTRKHREDSGTRGIKAGGQGNGFNIKTNTDTVNFSEEANNRLKSVSQETKDKQGMYAWKSNKYGGKVDSDDIKTELEELQQKLQEAQAELAEAQSELSTAQGDLASSDETTKASAEAKVVVASQKVAMAQSKVEMLMAQMMEKMKSK